MNSLQPFKDYKTTCLPYKFENSCFSNSSVSSHEDIYNMIFRNQEIKLYNLVLRLTKSAQCAQDITQDVFMKLWEHRDRMHEIDNVEAWLYRVTENMVMNFFRRAAADNRLRRAIWENLSEMVNDTGAKVESKEYNILIQKAIDKLPTRRKMIFQLSREKGLNYQEIAQELYISRHTVKNQLYESMKFIRYFLSGQPKHSSVRYQKNIF